MIYTDELFYNISVPTLDDSDFEIINLSESDLHQRAEADALAELPQLLLPEQH